MYLELLGELIKKSISKKSLAKQIGVTEKTLFNKLNGKTDFTFSEVKKIRDIVAPGESLDKLFEKTEIKNVS
ncbi:helix-turn-helix domain-containing protein [Clostridium neonatale]|uniref:HTH cro/C1-type domain-containing protein n=1 Tax=Clostridium neonatale TaxID=137838 RepID=A0AA86JXW5_9CLOT|nr:helix-turn-helix domain-containing protein [Clostridium neonatale]CAG9703673.1 conserved hypothetical protein [Clostridium neonatale]CAI3539163.1 conserved hypothetical protein [Clostridium neonatale]CAI3540059.1 conserved hypothetical protein [Clostridium neonatale]CAI3545649.1 conserved hypothetical protein [Clostridium neonatale]CAI3552237.1 conserved hypothetical protein [Clostridium neonatale]